MAVTITHDFSTLYNGNAGIGGADTYSGFQRFGTACNGGQVSNATNHWTTTVASFSLVGRRISTWMTAPASAAPIADGGYRIVIGDGTNTRAYYVGGGDVATFAQNGWFCFTLDGDSLPTGFAQLAGSSQPNLSALTLVGIGFNITTKAVGNSPNVFWDIMQVGTGLTVAGGTSGDPGIFDEIVAWDEQMTTATGTIRRVDAGVYGVQMRLTFGATGAASHFEDSNALVFFEGVPSGTDFYRLTVQGSSSHVNVFRLGERLGSGESSIGGAGVTLQSVRPWQLIANNANATVEFFGCTFRGATQGVLLGGEARSCVFDANGQVNPGTALMRFNTFSGYTGTDGAMLWNPSIDIQECDFNGNSRAVEHAATGTFTYTALGFSGNTYDINNTSGEPVTVNASAGSNPATFLGTVTINNTKNFTFTVQDAAGVEQTGYEWRLYIKDPTQGIIGTIELAGEEVATLSTQTYSYNYSGDTEAMLQIIETGFEEYLNQFTLGDVDQSVTIRLSAETNI